MRQPLETKPNSGLIFSPLFDNIWPRSAPSQVHAKWSNSMLSAIF